MSTAPLDAGEELGAQGRTGPNPQDWADSFVGARAQAMLSHPSRVAAIFWAGGVVAVAAAIPFGHWTHRSLLALVVIAGVCGTASAIRVTTGDRLPRWTLHVDAGAGTVLTSVLAAIGAADHVAFADLYVWIALFAAMYFRPLEVLAQVGAAAAAFAVVLAFGPKVTNPVVAWMAVVGTVTLAAAVLLGLVSVLRSAAREDPLTGLANRRAWDERLEDELARSWRTGQALSVVMIDLDGFKAVNDRGGHEAGDRLLQDLSRAWQAAVRGGGDFLARLGGDEFAILAPASDAIGVRRLAKRLGEVLPAGIAVSIGVATWDGTENASDLLRRADQTMYVTKLHHRRGEGLRPA